MRNEYHRFEPIKLQQAVNEFSEEEISKKVFKFKDLASGFEEQLNIDQIIKKIEH